jgi:tetratricopeptide (TPR) repeat protein
MACQQQASLSIRSCNMRNLVDLQESHLSDGINFVPTSSKDLSAQQHYDEGNVLLAQRRFAEAAACYDKAIALKPDYAIAHNNRGNAFRNLQRFQEALDSYDRALELQPYRQELLANRANALQNLERLEEAIACYESVIALKPDYAEAYSNYGVALKEIMRFEDAIASFDKALQLKPDYPEAIWNKSLVQLLLGEFDAGWRGYEARRKTKEFAIYRTFAAPLWLGDADISGRTILVAWEQGYGDVIQFSRYVSLCQQAGARVLFAPQKPLQELMRGLEAEVQIVDSDNLNLRFDFHCTLLSLPYAFKTTLRTIPPPTRISVDQGKMSSWARRLGTKSKPRIGVVWNSTGLSSKSIPIRQFQRLFDQRFQFIALQKHLTETERDILDRADVLHPGQALFDFTDTAALCLQMDLVITVDTSVAHLAGALGLPVWLLLQWCPDWRWLLNRDDTPWYPTMRLFRQQSRGGWEGLIERVLLELTSNFP